MSSYRQHLYHIITRTKSNKRVINQEKVPQLHAYISGIIRNKNSHLYRINSVEDHIHILTDINPSLAPVDFVKEVKSYSSKWMKGSGLFPNFQGWSEGYASLTCSYRDLEILIEYVKNQHEHHAHESFENEYRRLIEEAGIQIDEAYFP